MTLTAAQLEQRKTGIGGSDIGVIMGLSRYTTPMDTYNSKKGLPKTVPDPPWLQEAAWWGHAQEPNIVRWFQQHCPLVPVFWPTGRHPRYEYVFASPDRILTTLDTKMPVAGLECKNRSIFTKSKWGPTGSTTIPDDVFAQVQWNMEVFGLPQWYVAICLGGNEGRWYLIDRDDDFIQRALRNAERFWTQYVVPGNPPIDWEPE